MRVAVHRLPPFSCCAGEAGVAPGCLLYVRGGCSHFGSSAHACPAPPHTLQPGQPTADELAQQAAALYQAVPPAQLARQRGIQLEHSAAIDAYLRWEAAAGSERWWVSLIASSSGPAGICDVVCGCTLLSTCLATGEVTLCIYLPCPSAAAGAGTSQLSHAPLADALRSRRCCSCRRCLEARRARWPAAALAAAAAASGGLRLRQQC